MNRKLLRSRVQLGSTFEEAIRGLTVLLDLDADVEFHITDDNDTVLTITQVLSDYARAIHYPHGHPLNPLTGDTK